ncbi:hypothetical protein Tco_0781989 [Tanacetum coccineum]
MDQDLCTMVADPKSYVKLWEVMENGATLPKTTTVEGVVIEMPIKWPEGKGLEKILVEGNPQMDLQDQGVIDSGYSRHMKENMSYLTDYEEIDGGYVAFGGNPK